MIKLILPLVLILGIIGGVYLVQNRVNLFPFAAESGNFEERVTISNLSPNSFSVSYFTAGSYDFLQYGEDGKIDKVALDARSVDGRNPKLATHYFNLKDLKPNTKYYFKINSDGVMLPADSYLTVQTPGNIAGTPAVEMFKGRVVKEGSSPREAIVFLSTENGQVLSAPMKADGGFAIGFSGMRKADMSEYLAVDDTEQIKFLAYAGQDGFGLLGIYGLKKDNIEIDLSGSGPSSLPFYTINIGQPGVSNAEGESQGEGGLLVDLRKWLKI